MATKVNLRPLPADVWNLEEVNEWIVEENALKRYMMRNGVVFVGYPNGKAGWERRGAGKSLREVLEEWGRAHGYVLEWKRGNQHTVSVATLTRL